MVVNNFNLKILSRAKFEVNEAAEYYESKSKVLGNAFYLEFKNYSKTLRNIPFFEEKYNIVRILPLKKFPYTIHFTIDEFEKIVSIQAVTCDYQNPENTKLKI